MHGTITAYLPVEDIEVLRQRAARGDRSVSAELRRAVAAYIDPVDDASPEGNPGSVNDPATGGPNRVQV